MRVEWINNYAVMKIGLVNINYNEGVQVEKIKPLVDMLIYFDNNDLDDILKYIRDKDSLFITTYAFVNDNPALAMAFKKEIDKRKIRLDSILENTFTNEEPTNTLMFNIMADMYEGTKFIFENRIRES